jgi:general L-amino acid transport system substrate-binding protein
VAGEGHLTPGLRINNVIASIGNAMPSPLLRMIIPACVGLLCSLGGTAQAAGSPTLDAIRARGSVVCAMQSENVPFSLPDSKGIWRGMDVDSCRALAAAVFGDPSKIVIRPITGQTRFPTLQGGDADVLFGSTTWVTTRETSLGLVFAGANYYSGQGFITRATSGVKSVRELNEATICVPPGSSTEVILQDYFRKAGGSIHPVIIDDPSQIIATFLSGRCDAYTRDVTGLAGFRNQQLHPDELVILPEVISMEPLGPYVRKGDDSWLDVVRWTQFALIAAEQMGVTAANAGQLATTADPDIRRLLGVEGSIGSSMGLDPQWAAHAITAVGNYGEMWQRNVAPLGLPRGLNRLWNAGGLMFSPPLR